MIFHNLYKYYTAAIKVLAQYYHMDDIKNEQFQPALAAL